MEEFLKEEDLIKMKDAVDKAADSTIPFPIVKDGNIAVVGDANKTELNKHDFKIAFRIPDGNGGHMTKEVEYKDVYLTPRRSVTASRLITSMMPLFRKVKKDKTISEYELDEIREMVDEMDDNVIDLMYKLVSTVVGVSEELTDYMIPKSVLDSVMQILKDYPDLVNTGDAFFGF